MTCSILAYDNRCHDRPGWKYPAFSGVSGTWTTPIGNLGSQQLGLPAVFTAAAASVRVEFQAAVEVTVLALLGHTLPEDAEVEFADGASAIGTITVEGPGHAILILDNAATLSELVVNITDAAGGQIGVIWASGHVDMRQQQGMSIQALDTGFAAYAQGGAAWSARGNVGRRMPVRSRDTYANTFPAVEEALRTSGTTEPVLWIPAADLLEHAVYGLIQPGARIQQVSGKVWETSFEIRETL